MSEVTYTANIRIERISGPNRNAFLPATADPVAFGVHGAIAEHYGVDVKTPTATTLDYVIAAAGG